MGEAQRTHREEKTGWVWEGLTLAGFFYIPREALGKGWDKPIMVGQKKHRQKKVGRSGEVRFQPRRNERPIEDSDNQFPVDEGNSAVINLYSRPDDGEDTSKGLPRRNQLKPPYLEAGRERNPRHKR